MAGQIYRTAVRKIHGGPAGTAPQGDFELKFLPIEMSVTLPKPGPLISIHLQNGFALRPRSQDKEDGTTLPEPGSQTGGLGGCDSFRSACKHYREHVRHGGDYRSPASPGVRYQDQSIKCNAETCCRLDSEVRKPCHSTPGAIA
ncbi:hypothetical protein GCM10023063_13070 [Arthrobacter methylotrophus]